MIAELLALSWWTIFLFGLKAISAWCVARLVVLAPFIILRYVADA